MFTKTKDIDFKCRKLNSFKKIENIFFCFLSFGWEVQKY